MFKRVGLAIHDQPLADGLLIALQPTRFIRCARDIRILDDVMVLDLVAGTAVPSLSVGYARSAMVPLSGRYVFGERVDPLFWLGVELILAGMMITQYAGQSS
jgi:hypothetical protein